MSKHIVKLIGEDEKIPKGWRKLTSWKAEELLVNDFDAFKKLKKSTEVGYYRIENPNGNLRLLWLFWLDYYSYIYGNYSILDLNNGVRGVLIWKKK